MANFVLNIDDLPLIQGNKLRVFKSEAELAAFLLVVAQKHPKWSLEVSEAPEDLSLSKLGKKLHV